MAEFGRACPPAAGPGAAYALGRTEQKEARRLYVYAGFEIYGGEKHTLKNGEEYVDEDHMVLRFAN
jgi:hypothetical protein